MDEFSLIEKYFRPLARNFPGSLNLADDAALLDIPPNEQLIVTTDALVSGVHFIGDEDAALIARKSLRVNLSDLAAMGAAPLCYFLAVTLPRATKEPWIARFAEGLALDQKEFGIHLAGGDTTATPGPLTISVTALGTVPQGQALKRSGAKTGDTVYVSGLIGGAALGLQALRGQRARDEALIQRYLLPEPRLALGQQLRGIVSACMDISDGLVQDLGHICAASSVGAVVDSTRIPRAHPEAPINAGDDYELLFTASGPAPAGCTAIGEIVAGEGVRIMGESVPKGYKHF